MPAKSPVNLQVLRGLLARFRPGGSRDAKVTVGLDIGSTSVKVVALRSDKGGARTIIGQNLVPLAAGDGTVVPEAIKSAVETLKLPARSVNLSVSGQWVIMRVVEMPQMKPEELRLALPFEAQRYLPFNVDEVVIDGMTLGAATGNKAWVLIVACKKELLERRMEWVRQAGFEPALIDVDALALTNVFLAEQQGIAEGEDSRRALLNVGSHLSNLVVFKEGVPYLVRDIPWGGEKMLRQMSGQLGKELEVVSELLAKEKLTEELEGLLRTACEGLVAELQLSFDYFENRFGQPPDTVLVSGGLSQSAHFLEALKSHVTQTVTPWKPIGGLSGQFVVAYGLALRTS